MIAWKLLLQGGGGSKPLSAGRPDLSFKVSVVKRAKKNEAERRSAGRLGHLALSETISSNTGLNGWLVVGIFGGKEPRPGPPPWGLGEACRRRRVRGPGLPLWQRRLMTAKHTFLNKKGVVPLVGAHMSALQNICLQRCGPSRSSPVCNEGNPPEKKQAGVPGWNTGAGPAPSAHGDGGTISADNRR